MDEIIFFYLIMHNDCDQEYVGQMKCQFGMHFNEHQKDVFFQKGNFWFDGVCFPNAQYDCSEKFQNYRLNVLLLINNNIVINDFFWCHGTIQVQYCISIIHTAH